MDGNNYVGPEGTGWVVVIGGQVIGRYPSQQAAQDAYNAAGGPTSQPSTPSTPSVQTTPTATPGSQNTTVDPRAVEAAYQLANANAQWAYNNAKLRLEEIWGNRKDANEKEALAQQAKRDAWQESVARSGVSQEQVRLDLARGTLIGNIDGTPTLAARQQEFDQGVAQAGTTGYYTPPGAQNVTQRVIAAWEKLPPEQRTADAAVAIWQSVAGLNADQARQMAARAGEYYRVAQTGMPDDVVNRELTAIGARPQQATLEREQYETGASGYLPGGTATLERERFADSSAQGWQRLANEQRGPDNAFAYLNTQANIPEAVRQTINTALAGRGMTQQQAAGAGQPPAGTMQVGGMVRNAAVGAAPGFTAPEQIAPRDWNNATDYQKQMTLAAYEAGDAQGNKYDKSDVLDRMKRALPKYSGPRQGLVRV